MSARVTTFDKHMPAAAFAEAGEHETAKDFHRPEPQPVQQKKPAPVSAKKKPYLGMLVFGALSLSGYIALITNQKLVTEVYTMGGWHAVYPVGTALIFSFVHGAFASNLLSVLGIEAKKH